MEAPKQNHVAIQDLLDGTWVLAALAAAAREPRLGPEHAHILTEAGIDVVGHCDPPTVELLGKLAEPELFASRIAGLLRQAADLAEGVEHQGDNIEAVVSEGMASGRRVVALLEHFGQACSELTETLSQEGVIFLDVGTGVGGVSLALVAHLPSASAVAIDIDVSVLEVAQRQLRECRQAGSVELRHQDVRSLNEVDVYHLAWVSVPVLSTIAAREAAAKVYGALRPGGWLLAVAAPGDSESGDRSSLTGAIARWRLAARGCCSWGREELEAVLREHGFTELCSARLTPADPPAVLARKPYSAHFDGGQ